ncbi:matrixin family metalloprotease [Sanguibacter massiliensis]|uniref:matrixin family metalloprotease n=1 Tax=Sanguibacter massiliensis TaxID=1973217 RepID=UPI0013EBD161|nr:matrixin family metalloprotease [Sanguibacter massiliensis]
MTTSDGPPDDAWRRGRHAADPSRPLPSGPPQGPARSPYDPPETPPSGAAGPASWTPQEHQGAPQLSDEAYERAFAEIERAAAGWAPSARDHLRVVGPPASPYGDPRGWSAPPAKPRRRGGWLVLVLVVVLTVVVLDRGLGTERLSPTLDVPRAQWLGDPRAVGGDAPRPGEGEQRERILPAVTTPQSGPYATLSEGATWSPCRTIRVVIDPTHAPAGFEEWVGHVLAEASRLSGLSIVLEGTTDERVSFDREPYQPSRYGERWAPAIIGWASDAEIPELVGNVAGLGGAQQLTRGNQTGYVTGGVALDVELLRAPRQRGEPAYVGVLRHEVGHLLGLGHVDEPAALMYGGANNVSTWGPGEVEGLAALGAGRCTPRL